MENIHCTFKTNNSYILEYIVDCISSSLTSQIGQIYNKAYKESSENIEYKFLIQIADLES